MWYRLTPEGIGISAGAKIDRMTPRERHDAGGVKKKTAGLLFHEAQPPAGVPQNTGRN
jgi:hypothetical protein